MKKILRAIIKRTLLNWEHPRYSMNLFKFCSQYVDLCYGDMNFNRKTNGENMIVRTIIPNCHVVFDVGANDGTYSSYMLSINPNVEIHAFEPGNQAYKALRLLPLTANNFALGEKKEKKTLYCDNQRSTHNSLYDPGLANGSKQEIQIEILDDYCLSKNIKHVDFLKIDVEGHEYFVLKGAQKLFENNAVDYVQFEFSGGSREARTFLKDFMDFFDKYGFDLYRIKPLSIEKVIYNPGKERFTLTNYLAIKKTLIVPPGLHAKDRDF